jgi:hypothetical protein
MRALVFAGLIAAFLLVGAWPAQIPAPFDLPAQPAEAGRFIFQASPTPTQSPCYYTGASATPSTVNAGTPVVIAASGFNPRSTVTITITGPTKKDPITVTTDTLCRANYSVQTTGDLPGTYDVVVNGMRFASEFGTFNQNTRYVVNAPTPTTAPTTAPPTSATQTCPAPFASMLSARVTPPASATIIGRGFQPGSAVRVEIFDPTGRTARTDFPTAGINCDVRSTYTPGAADPPGHYLVNLSGVNAAGAGVTAQTEFDLLGTGGPTPSGPTATLPPDVVPTATPSPTLPPPPPPAPGDAPITISQNLVWTGGSSAPVVGQPIEYRHTMSITNTGGPITGSEIRVRAAALGLGYGGPGAWDLVILAQGDTLVLRTTTDYSDDTRIVSANANVGQTSIQGSTLVWEGRLSPGETLVLSSNLQQTPTSPGVNTPVEGVNVQAASSSGVPLRVTPPRPPSPPPAQRFVAPPPPPVDPLTGPRLFTDTGFAVADDSIWQFYVRRGGQRTFGSPISRLMLLNGAWVQIFEKGMLQAFEDRVVSVNMLEPPYLPYESVGDLVLPPSDDGLIASAPDPAGPNFATQAQDFVRDNAPEFFEQLAPHFYETFLGTVRFSDAFFDGRGDANLIPGFNLEIWGLPTSRPALSVSRDQVVDPGVALLRFQRGLMIHDSRAGTTGAAPLGYALRSIIAGDASQPGLAEVAAFSPIWGQYDPDAVNWVARPDELAETNLVLAFTRDDNGEEAVPIAASRSQVQLLLEILSPTSTYDDDGNPVGDAAPGERYLVLQQDGGWVRVVREGDTVDAAVWIELDGRVRASIQ